MSDRFRRAIVQAWKTIEKEQWIFGTLGRILTDGSYVIVVPGRNNFVFVTLRHSTGAQTVVEARNDAGVRHSPKLGVKMKLEFGHYVIYGRAGTSQSGTDNTPTPPEGVEPHTHPHSDLTGLTSGDDHTQYHNDARGDARYFTEAEHLDVSAGSADAGKPLKLNADGEVDSTMLPTLGELIGDGAVDDSILDADLFPRSTAGVAVNTAWSNIKSLMGAYIASVALTLTNKTLDSTNISTLTAKTTPIDADSAVIVDSAAANVFKRTTYTNIKAFLKTYFDTLYGGLAAANTWSNTQTFSDSALLLFIHSGVAHGMTTVRPTDRWGDIAILHTSNGGMQIVTLSDTDAVAFQQVSIIGSDVPTNPVYNWVARKKNGTGSQALAAAEIAYRWQNLTTTLLTLLGNGSLTMVNGSVLTAETMRAIDSTGLLFLDDAGIRAIFVEDGGQVAIGASGNPANLLDIILASGASGGVGLQVTGQTNGYAGIQNFTNTSNQFAPAFVGQSSDGIPIGLLFVGIPPTDTASDIAMRFSARTRAGAALATAIAVEFATGSTVLSRIFANGKHVIGDLTTVGASILGVRAGTSSNDAAVGGVLYTDATEHANVSTTETDLASYSVPANTLAVNGQSLEIEAWGFHASSANVKTLRLKWGATNLLLITGTPLYNWHIRFTIIRTGAATQRIVGIISPSPAIVTPFHFATASETLSGAVTLKLTGQGGASNEVFQYAYIVRWSDANS